MGTPMGTPMGNKKYNGGKAPDWSPAETALLLQCKKERMEWREIVPLLPGRTKYACQYKYFLVKPTGLSPTGAKPDNLTPLDRDYYDLGQPLAAFNPISLAELCAVHLEFTGQPFTFRV